MKFIITENQLKLVIEYIHKSFLLENEEWRSASLKRSKYPTDGSEDEDEINLISSENKIDIDFIVNKRGLTDEVLNNFDKLITYLYATSLIKKETTQTRIIGQNFYSIIKKISDEISPNFKELIKIIVKILKNYGKSDRLVLKKLWNIIKILGKESDIPEKLIEKAINLLDDVRFGAEDFKKLLEFLIDFSNRENETPENFLDIFFKKLSKNRDYEESFAHKEKIRKQNKKTGQKLEYEKDLIKNYLGPSFFVLDRTSPEIGVNLSSDYINEEIEIRASIFNKLSDVQKAIYIIDEISKKTSLEKSPNDLINEVLNSLNFMISFQETKTNVKRDLKALTDLHCNDCRQKGLLIKEGDDVEVKMKPYNVPDFLSEFFKIDANKTGISKIKYALSKIDNIGNVEETYKLFINKFVERLFITITEKQKSFGLKIIDHLTKKMVGMIFQERIYIPVFENGKEYINFSWCKIKGYSGNDRLAVCYNVDSGAPKYTFMHDDSINKFNGNVRDF